MTDRPAQCNCAMGADVKTCDVFERDEGCFKCGHDEVCHAPAAPPERPGGDERGLYRKYTVRRNDDPTEKHADCEYFVLDWQHDPFAIPAMEAYVAACSRKYPSLAADIVRNLKAYRPIHEPTPPADVAGPTVNGPPHSDSHLPSRYAVLCDCDWCRAHEEEGT